MDYLLLGLAVLTGGCSLNHRAPIEQPRSVLVIEVVQPADPMPPAERAWLAEQRIPLWQRYPIHSDPSDSNVSVGARYFH